MPMINIIREMYYDDETAFGKELCCTYLPKVLHTVLISSKQIDGDYRLNDILKGRRGLTLEEREGRGALLVKGRRAHMIRLLE